MSKSVKRQSQKMASIECKPLYVIRGNNKPNLKECTENAATKVLDRIYESQKICQDTSFTIECSEDRLKENLNKRHRNFEQWVRIFGELVKKLENEIDVISSEQNMLVGVLEKLETKIESHVLVRGTSMGIVDHAVEIELRRELNMLRRSKDKIIIKKSQYQKLAEKLEQTKSKLEQSIKDKTAVMLIEKQMFNIKPKGAFHQPRPKKQSKIMTPQAWLRKCEQLKSASSEVVEASKHLVREVTGECLRISGGIQDQARRVDLALKLRINNNRTELNDLEWRVEEIRDEIENLRREELITENILLETMEQLKQLEQRKMSTHIIPPPEMFQDEALKIYRREIVNVKECIKRLASDIASNQTYRDFLEGLQNELNAHIEEKTQIILMDERRLDARYRPEKSNSTISSYVTKSSNSNTGLSTITEES